MKAKKFFALFLAVVMVLSVSITAFAVNSDGESYTRGKITITNPQDGVNYSAYKIFDVTYVEGTTKYAYTIAPAWVDDVVAYATPANTTLADDWTTTTANGLTVTKNAAGGYNVTISDAFSAADFGEKMSAQKTGKTADATFTDGVAADLDLGYYMVQPTTANALVSLTTTDTDVEITDKNEMPVVEKKIVETQSKLICTDVEHTHTEECYQGPASLSCEKQEHTHTKSECYQGELVLTCPKVEHTHGRDCYQDGVLSCGLTEHTHVYADGHCYTASLSCTLEEHTHDAVECYQGPGTLVCTKTAHTHGDTCYSTTETEETKKDYTTKSVGDTVNFELDTKVPDMTGYQTYFFVMNDTMDKGLTFNDDVVITLGGTELTAGTDYTVKDVVNEDGTTNIRIVFNDMKKWWNNDPDEDKAGEPIVIKYSATVNESAVMGTTGNSNSAKIEYSNNPNIVPEGKPIDDDDDPETPDVPDTPEDPYDPKDPAYKHNGTETTEDDPTGTSESDKVTVYTAELSITKVDADGGASLTGAKFKIEGEKLNVAIVNQTIFEESTDGTWYRLKDGTYTQTAPYNPTEEEPEFTYVAKGEDFEPVTFELLPERVPNVGLYYTPMNSTEKILITDETDIENEVISRNSDIYRPTYNTPGLYVEDDTASSSVEGADKTYVEVTEENAADLYSTNPSRTYYTRVQHKQSDLYEDVDTTYKKVEVINKDTTVTEDFQAEGFVGNDGVITFKGLAEGTYYITELVAPDGYNLLKAPVKVDVALAGGSTAGSYAFKAKINDAETAILENAGMLSFEVENSQGMELPETGGIGRTIFYILGGLLILGAGILLIVRKRMSFEG